MYDPKNKYSKYIFVASFVILAYLAYMLVKPVLSAIVVGMLLGYLVMPMHARLKSLIKSGNLSALIITLVAVAIAVIIVTVATNMLVNETIAIYEKFTLGDVTDAIGKYIPSEKLEQYVTDFAARGLEYMLNFASALLFKVPEILIWLFIAIIVFFFTLRDFEKLKEKVRAVMPVSEQYKNKIISRFSRTVDAVVYSTILLSIVEGVIATMGYYIFGVKTALVWGIITMVVSMLPFIGPALVWVPMAVYKFIAGDTTAAVGLTIYSLLLLTILGENVVKPHLISRKGKMHPIVALLGVIGGISVFGMSGLILGPFVLSIFLFILEVLLGNQGFKVMIK